MKNQLTRSILILLGLIFTQFIGACSSPPASYLGSLQAGLATVDDQDGINKSEAKTIADAYLFVHGQYQGRPSFARISDDDVQFWHGKVFAVKSLASPINIDVEPIQVEKRHGTVSWLHGPTLKIAELRMVLQGPLAQN